MTDSVLYNVRRPLIVTFVVASTTYLSSIQSMVALTVRPTLLFVHNFNVSGLPPSYRELFLPALESLHRHPAVTVMPLSEFNARRRAVTVAHDCLLIEFVALRALIVHVTTPSKIPRKVPFEAAVAPHIMQNFVDELASPSTIVPTTCRGILHNDMHPYTYAGGMEAAAHVAERFNIEYQLIATHGYNEYAAYADLLRRRGIEPKTRFAPLCVDSTRLYDGHNVLPLARRETDVLLYGAAQRTAYPFRSRLFRLLQSKASLPFNVKRITYDQKTYGSVLWRAIASAKLTIATPGSSGYFVLKYVEIPAAGGVLAGNMPPDGAYVYSAADYVDLRPNMSDATIISTIERYLANNATALSRASTTFSQRIRRLFDCRERASRYIDALDPAAPEIPRWLPRH